MVCESQPLLLLLLELYLIMTYYYIIKCIRPRLVGDHQHRFSLLPHTEEMLLSSTSDDAATQHDTHTHTHTA